MAKTSLKASTGPAASSSLALAAAKEHGSAKQKIGSWDSFLGELNASAATMAPTLEKAGTETESTALVPLMTESGSDAHPLAIQNTGKSSNVAASKPRGHASLLRVKKSAKIFSVKSSVSKLEAALESKVQKIASEEQTKKLKRKKRATEKTLSASNSQDANAIMTESENVYQQIALRGVVKFFEHLVMQQTNVSSPSSSRPIAPASTTAASTTAAMGPWRAGRYSSKSNKTTPST